MGNSWWQSRRWCQAHTPSWLLWDSSSSVLSGGVSEALWSWLSQLLCNLQIWLWACSGSRTRGRSCVGCGHRVWTGPDSRRLCSLSKCGIGETWTTGKRGWENLERSWNPTAYFKRIDKIKIYIPDLNLRNFSVFCLIKYLSRTRNCLEWVKVSANPNNLVYKSSISAFESQYTNHHQSPDEFSLKCEIVNWKSDWNCFFKLLSVENWSNYFKLASFYDSKRSIGIQAFFPEFEHWHLFWKNDLSFRTLGICSHQTTPFHQKKKLRVPLPPEKLRSPLQPFLTSICFTVILWFHNFNSLWVNSSNYSTHIIIIGLFQIKSDRKKNNSNCWHPNKLLLSFHSVTKIISIISWFINHWLMFGKNSWKRLIERKHSRNSFM